MGFKVASRVRGLSDEAFREAFGAEEQCRSALSRLRWPDGFVCPACGHRGHCVLAGRSLYQCYRCKKQTSSTAGTIFHATKLPLTLWFAAVHLIVTAKNGISSVELGRRLGVKQPTAWTMKHKIMAVMARREAAISAARPSNRSRKAKTPSSGHACRVASSVTTPSGSNSTRSPTISATSCRHSCCPMQWSSGH